MSENASLPPYIGPTALFQSINFNQGRHPNSCRTGIDFGLSLVISQLTEAYTSFCRRYELNVILFQVNINPATVKYVSHLF